MAMRPVINSLLVLLAALTVSSAPNNSSYVCPPNFIRLSHRCYFFSKEKATWHEAYFQCQSMHSNLAILKNSNQDKLIRKTLSRKTLEPLERWLGGRFDWQQKQWKWAASGKPLTYKGFDKSVNQDEENLQWSCMIVDPALQYKWNARSCLKERHYICQKKLQTVTNNKTRKKLFKQYNTNQLNEIPVPKISNHILRKQDNLKKQPVKSSRSDPFHIEIYPLAFDAKPAYRKKEKRNKKKRRNRPEPALRQFPNGTVYENNGSPSVVLSDQPYRRRRNKVKDDEIGQYPMKIYYKTYKESSRNKHPLHPNPIVEEYNLAKEV